MLNRLIVACYLGNRTVVVTYLVLFDAAVVAVDGSRSVVIIACLDLDDAAADAGLNKGFRCVPITVLCLGSAVVVARQPSSGIIVVSFLVNKGVVPIAELL